MQSELRHLQKAVGITFILVTHDQEEALTMSDKVAVMFDGKVEQVASPRDLYERPSTQRVASFIGAMNFIECKVLEKGKNLKIRDPVLGSFDLSKEQVSGVSSNNSITIGIRPEMISILPKGSKIKNSISGKVSDISYFGETTYYKIKCDIDSKIFNISAQNSFGHVDYSIGEKIEFKIDLKSIVGFLK
jgi:spermidine/putrescine transport system ATP-binding protein